MKKWVSALVVSAALMGLSFGQSSSVKELGDGFQLKERGSYTLVHFPEECFVKFEAFKQCIDKSLIKVLGCKEFALCKPKLQEGSDGIFVKTQTQGFISISPLYADETQQDIVGVVLNKKKEGVITNDE